MPFSSMGPRPIVGSVASDRAKALRTGDSRERDRHRRHGNREVGSRPDQARGRTAPADCQVVFPVGSARPGSVAAWRGAGGVESLRRPSSGRRAGVRCRLLRQLGYDRPIYFLAHDVMFHGPIAELLPRIGAIHANRGNAATALRAGAVVMVFPGGDYEVYRPTLSENVIDFEGRTGYVRTAIDAGVPIVPAVSIGGQENQFYLSRGIWLAQALRLDNFEHRFFRTNILPIAFGFPFGLSILVPVNMPLPTKIVTQVLKPIDIVAQFGEDPDVDEVDAHVRRVMQKGLDELAAKRRFPILG